MATPPNKETSSKTMTSKHTSGAALRSDLNTPLYLPRLDSLQFDETLEKGAGPDYSQILESICGVADDSQPVEKYNGTLGVTTSFVSAHQKQAVQVQWNSNLGSIYTNQEDVNGVRWGSGTMISANLLLTCGHLFDVDPNGWRVPRQNGTNTAISPQEIATNMHVNFLYQVDSTGTMRAEQSFPITQLIEYRLGGIDMAICRIGDNPGNTYGFSEVSATNPVVGDMLAIIGHPAGQPKRIEAGPCTSITATTVRYNDIDTLGGNSGSGILQASTGRVVGVHTNGGCNTQSPAGGGSNSGVAIQAIRNVSPTLQALPIGSRTASADDNIVTQLSRDVSTRLALDTIGDTDTLLASDLFTSVGADTPPPSTLRALDTHKATDILGTLYAMDAPPPGTLRALDTHAAADIGTSRASDDPNNTIQETINPVTIQETITRRETIINPGNVYVDQPFVITHGGGLRPLVLAGASALGGEATKGDDNLGLIAELEMVIEHQRAMLERLESILASLIQVAE